MIQPPDSRTWPRIDILPFRRDVGGPWPEPGVMFAWTGATVYLTDAFTPGLMGRLRTCGTINYPSFADIAADGWAVDGTQ